MCEISQLPPSVMQDLTPLTQVHKVIILNKFSAGSFSLINGHRPLWFFLPNFSNTIAELPESCKFTGRPLNLPGQRRISRDTRNIVQELCGFHLQGSPCSKRSKPPWGCPGPLWLCSPVFLSPADGLVSGFHGQWKGFVGIFIWKQGLEWTEFSLWQPPGTLVLGVFLAVRCSSFRGWEGVGKGGRVWIHLDFSLSPAAKYAESHYQKRKICLCLCWDWSSEMISGAKALSWCITTLQALKCLMQLLSQKSYSDCWGPFNKLSPRQYFSKRLLL